MDALKIPFISHCSVSPLHQVGLDAAIEFHRAHSEKGVDVFADFTKVESTFRQAFGALLQTKPENIAFTTSTSHALNCLANEYPFSKGDRILTYKHEFPSNYYPWIVAKRNFGAEVDELPDVDPIGNLPEDCPRGWLMEDLERLVTKNTKIIAISHVQFTSGYAADLSELGKFCREKNIDLVVDAAQSLGALPIFPEKYNISAIASSGWKYLLGPHGASVFYTSPEFREKLKFSAGGWSMMKQGFDYLNHTWDPHLDSRRFEFTTPPFSLVHSLGQIAEKVFVANGIEKISQLMFARQDQLISGLDRDLYSPLLFPTKNRSGLLAVRTSGKTSDVIAKAAARGLTLTERGGYLRLAPHFHNSTEDIELALEVLNSLK